MPQWSDVPKGALVARDCVLRLDLAEVVRPRAGVPRAVEAVEALRTDAEDTLRADDEDDEGNLAEGVAGASDFFCLAADSSVAALLATDRVEEATEDLVVRGWLGRGGGAARLEAKEREEAAEGDLGGLEAAAAAAVARSLANEAAVERTEERVDAPPSCETVRVRCDADPDAGGGAARRVDVLEDALDAVLGGSALLRPGAEAEAEAELTLGAGLPNLGVVLPVCISSELVSAVEVEAALDLDDWDILGVRVSEVELSDDVVEEEANPEEDLADSGELVLDVVCVGLNARERDVAEMAGALGTLMRVLGFLVTAEAALRLRMDVRRGGSPSLLAADLRTGLSPVRVAGRGGGSSTAIRSCGFMSSSNPGAISVSPAAL